MKDFFQSALWLLLITGIAGALGYFNQILLVANLKADEFTTITLILACHVILNIPINAYCQSYVTSYYAGLTRYGGRVKRSFYLSFYVSASLFFLCLFDVVVDNDYLYYSLITALLSSTFFSINYIYSFFLAKRMPVSAGLIQASLHLLRLLIIALEIRYRLGFRFFLLLLVSIQFIPYVFAGTIRGKVCTDKVEQSSYDIASSSYISHGLLMFIANADLLVLKLLNVGFIDEYAKLSAFSKIAFYLVMPINNSVASYIKTHPVRKLILSASCISLVSSFVIMFVFVLFNGIVFDRLGLQIGSSNSFFSLFFLSSAMAILSLCNLLDIGSLSLGGEPSSWIYIALLIGLLGGAAFGQLTIVGYVFLFFLMALLAFIEKSYIFMRIK